jgi:hypothetical protein|tara:strand:+ start:182 stop:526 length:345 start_codon:yes stop_codon:yes gene_type:complete|eukprot:SAG11_NODE_41_length_21459_cov_5.742884_22_plen_115_part_00
MAKQEIKLNKQVFGKISYPKVIDTEFKQLVKPEEVLTIDEPLTIPEFFAEYDKLFFEIPQKGAGSHDEIIKRSAAYIGVTGQSEQIQALLDEINELRAQLLSSQQEIVNLSTSI